MGDGIRGASKGGTAPGLFFNAVVKVSGFERFRVWGLWGFQGSQVANPLLAVRILISREIHSLRNVASYTMNLKA